ncbi:hypothetical protein CEJ86_33150 [Sinorhizobium meliloti]|uniref:Uncharacterized protein n=1 Tax=Rhizobium meliloti TaxID=382 RepID=A0A2J0YSQ6_RHIML|nr:hypothetical protein CEJ86_33150 [Sinorhizobium meliloti]
MRVPTAPTGAKARSAKPKAPSAAAYTWCNLTLVCNGNKGDYCTDDPGRSQDALIDPYVDDPAEHFLFMREVVVQRPDSTRAKPTEAVIKLSRLEFLGGGASGVAFIDGVVQTTTSTSGGCPFLSFPKGASSVQRSDSSRLTVKLL